MKVTDWPKEQYGEFHEDDSYIVLNSHKIQELSQVVKIMSYVAFISVWVASYYIFNNHIIIQYSASHMKYTFGLEVGLHTIRRALPPTELLTYTDM